MERSFDLSEYVFPELAKILPTYVVYLVTTRDVNPEERAFRIRREARCCLGHPRYFGKDL